LHDFVSRDLTTRFTVSANELVFKHRLKTATRQWFICNATTIKKDKDHQVRFNDYVTTSSAIA